MHLNLWTLRSRVSWKRAILPAESNRWVRSVSKVAEEENTICIYKKSASLPAAAKSGDD